MLGGKERSLGSYLEDDLADTIQVSWIILLFTRQISDQALVLPGSTIQRSM